MAYTYGTLSAFTGVRMDLSQALMRADMSPDACNVDTRSGDLKTATGFSSIASGELPENETPIRLYLYPNEHGFSILVVTETALYCYDSPRRAWRQIYTFETELTPERIGFAHIRIGTDDRLLITTGCTQALLYDATAHEVTPFGSAQKLSDVPISCAALHFGRLFASGNMLQPSRLYWSKTPGSGRTIDDWRADDASENVSGGFVDVGVGEDPITGLIAMSNQLLIVTRNAMYRLLGDRPSNFRIVKIETSARMPAPTACAAFGDRLFFLTDDGLSCYDGQTVRRPSNADAVTPLLKRSNLAFIASAAAGDCLYFAFRSDVGAHLDTMVEYDVRRGCFMLRSGFTFIDLSTVYGSLYALTVDGRVVRFDDSHDYDGSPIEAWWCTPVMDLGHKEADKTLLSLTATGTGTLRVRAEANGAWYDAQAELCEIPYSVTEIPLRGVGRVFRLRFSNINGAQMRLDANPLLLYDIQRRPV